MLEKFPLLIPGIMVLLFIIYKLFLLATFYGYKQAFRIVIVTCLIITNLILFSTLVPAFKNLIFK